MSQYEKYKLSGIEWIGEIPEHWELKKIKYKGKTIAGGTPATANSDYWDGDIPWLNSGKVQNCIINFNDVDRYITELGLKESATKLIRENSVLIALTGATCANIGYLTFQSTANQSVVAIENDLSLNSKFLYYYLFSQREQILIYKTGGAQSGINEGDVKNLILCFPTKEEQTTIATYLDQKTTEIDKIIANKQKLITLYEEEKQAVINKAVTNGIKPDVKLKPSGVEWLGDIPEHWEVKKLKYIVTLIIEKSDGEEIKIALENIESKTGKYIKSNSVFEGDGIHFNIGYILYGKLRPYLAKVWVSEFEGSAVGDFFVLKLMKNYNSNFLKYRLLSTSFTNVANGSTFGAKMPRVGWDFLSDLYFAFPKLGEQETIVFFIEQECNRIDLIIDKYKKQIELFQEYRITLISEVVTGKVKVS